MNRILGVALLATLAAPSSIAGQKDGVPQPAPLRSLCSSITMDYCVSFYAFELYFPPLGTRPGSPVQFYDLQIAAGFQAWGKSVGDWEFAGTDMDLWSFSGDGWDFSFRGLCCRVRETDVKDVYEMSGFERPFGEADLPPRDPTIADATYFHFRNPETGELLRFDSETWVEVPEPSTYLLLFSGLVALGLVTRRRIRLAGR